MSALAVAPAPATRLPLTSQVSELAQAVWRGCAGVKFLVAGRGRAAQHYHHAGGFAALPTWLLRELRFAPADDLVASFATFDKAHGSLVNVGAAWSEIALPPVWDGHKFRTPETLFDAAVENLCSFPLALSALIDAGWGLTAIWLLTEPAKLSHPDDLAAFERLQERLALAVGGRVDPVTALKPRYQAARPGDRHPADTLPAWSVRRASLRIPGSRNRDHGGPDGARVFLAQAALERRYSVAQIEAASADTSTSTPKKS